MSFSEHFNSEIAPLADIDLVTVDYDLCEVADCFDLATVRVERFERPVPMDPSEDYLADHEFCNAHYEADEERDRKVQQLGEVLS